MCSMHKRYYGVFGGVRVKVRTLPGGECPLVSNKGATAKFGMFGLRRRKMEEHSAPCGMNRLLHYCCTPASPGHR